MVPYSQVGSAIWNLECILHEESSMVLRFPGRLAKTFSSRIEKSTAEIAIRQNRIQWHRLRSLEMIWSPAGENEWKRRMFDCRVCGAKAVAVLRGSLNPSGAFEVKGAGSISLVALWDLCLNFVLYKYIMNFILRFLSNYQVFNFQRGKEKVNDKKPSRWALSWSTKVRSQEAGREESPFSWAHHTGLARPPASPGVWLGRDWPLASRKWQRPCKLSQAWP